MSELRDAILDWMAEDDLKVYTYRKYDEAAQSARSKQGNIMHLIPSVGVVVERDGKKYLVRKDYSSGQGSLTYSEIEEIE